MLQQENNVILLNKPFLGGWLDKKGHIGHEIIDFLLTDDNQYYVYNNPWGACPDDIWIEGTTSFPRNKSEIYTGKYLVLTGGERIRKEGKELDILYVIKLAEKLHRYHTGAKILRANQDAASNIIRAKNIKYNGKYLDEIYENDDALYLTFRGEKIYRAKNPLRVTGLDYDFRRNKGYLYSDRNADDYNKMLSLIEKSIENGSLVEFRPRNVRQDTIGDLNTSKTFLDLIGLATDEQVFTNILYNLLAHGELLKHFCDRFKESSVFDTTNNFKVFRETKVVDGRMDVCAESDIQRVIIENKVYSGLNGLKPADKISQLSTYYKWGTQKSLPPLCFIVAPNFRTTEITREIAEKDPSMANIYKILTYGDVAAFIEDELATGNISDDYQYFSLLPNIINAFKNLSYTTKEDQYARMFLNATNS